MREGYVFEREKNDKGINKYFHKCCNNVVRTLTDFNLCCQALDFFQLFLTLFQKPCALLDFYSILFNITVLSF